ncbi:MAG: hypothetical protein IT462_14750 [Planctomycetes bacterium]|nr:hypothetical protein [Planctomycetota bacterium]
MEAAPLVPRSLPSQDAGILNIRAALRVVRLRQSKQALKAAAHMTLLLPFFQAAVLVGLLNAEPWMGLLCLEGLLIGGLAAGQLKRANAESRSLGFAAALLNASFLGALGLFLGSHVFWILGLATMAPVTALTFLPTGARTVGRARMFFGAAMLIALGLAGAARAALMMAPTEKDPANRQLKLVLAFGALSVRGGNGTERALLRLRQAQAAFEARDYARAFDMAHDGLLTPESGLRGIPNSGIAQGLAQSLLMVKAQALYNRTWGKDDPLVTPIKPEPIDASMLGEKDISVRWGY